MTTSLITKIQSILTEPSLIQNLNGQLRAALNLLDIPAHRWLACDYAERGLWLCEPVHKNEPALRQVLEVMRAYLRESLTWENVVAAHHDLYRVDTGEIRKTTNFEEQIAHEAWTAIHEAMSVCCDEALKKARIGIWTHKWRPDAMVVATQVSYAVALKAAGNAWNDSDIIIRAAARKQGHQAQDAETKWQLEHLLNYIILSGK